MRLARGQDGITGIETAILLLAFVVVASAFSMAMLRTGALSAERSGRVASEGVNDSLSALPPLGDVVGIADPTDKRLDKVILWVTASGAGSAGVHLSATSTRYPQKVCKQSGGVPSL